ncbi:MAG: hypothetical protein HC835_14235 [Oscillatoriales cyanobacterium RM2_1_1]|nr:hypothetical protein [Oscillatoriales cyanobacterium SM2_3_0]NJO46681.1 hypothetical protein [Oscillatoriales cyanobacterium RM2_1_1]
MPDLDQRPEPNSIKQQLANLREQVQGISKDLSGDNLALLALLRTLENLHQEIRDTLFQDTLPDNRQALYHLLREVESEGGWPYIPRMSLRSLQEKLQNQFQQEAQEEALELEKEVELK